MSRLTQQGAGQRDNNNARKTPYVDASMAPRIGSMFAHTTPRHAECLVHDGLIVMSGIANSPAKALALRAGPEVAAGFSPRYPLLTNWAVPRPTHETPRRPHPPKFPLTESQCCSQLQQ